MSRDCLAQQSVCDRALERSGTMPRLCRLLILADSSFTSSASRRLRLRDTASSTKVHIQARSSVMELVMGPAPWVFIAPSQFVCQQLISRTPVLRGVDKPRPNLAERLGKGARRVPYIQSLESVVHLLPPVMLPLFSNDQQGGERGVFLRSQTFGT